MSITEKKREYMLAYREKNREVLLKQSRERQAARRKTEAYRQWLVTSAELRKSLKAKYRREAGMQTRADLAAVSAARQEANTKAAAVKAAFVANFVGPRKPGRWLGDAVLYAWRTTNDPIFYAKELDRAQEYKARKRPGYKGSILGWKQMPSGVIASKHLLYLISKQLKGSKGNEKH